VSGTTSSSNLNTAAGGGTGMAFALSNYNPLSDFPSNTKFQLIRRAYTSNCGVCVGGCLDQSFYLNLTPVSAAPGITGSYASVIELLRDSGINRENGKYKSLHELTEQEMSNLITSIMLRTKNQESVNKMIGNIYLIKFLNRIEDAREISALINSCSRMDHPEIALGFCLGNKSFKEQAEKIYIEYKQHLFSALKYVSETEKIKGNKYEIINAKNNIKDTIIGTVASIISHSPLYQEGTIIVALAYNEDKIKVSARIAGREGRNVRDVLNKIVVPLGGEVGGHPNAAGCLISKENETIFIEELKKELEVEFLKV
jgi:hypothetical protein